MSKLTAKQNRFIEEYCSNGFNATQAAKAAGYSEKTSNKMGSENLAKPLIQQGIQAFMGKASERAMVTVESLLAELDENRQIALAAETPQAGAANTATMGKAKLCGLDIVRTEIKTVVTDSKDFEW